MLARTLLTAVKYQILNGCHVAGFDGETLIGYCGWLQITKAEGEEWMQGNGELRPAPPSGSDVLALHIVRIDGTIGPLPLIRRAGICVSEKAGVLQARLRRRRTYRKAQLSAECGFKSAPQGKAPSGGELTLSVGFSTADCASDGAIHSNSGS